jgi:hypothetical protein
MADLKYKILYNGGRFRSVKYDKIFLRLWVVRMRKKINVHRNFDGETSWKSTIWKTVKGRV